MNNEILNELKSRNAQQVNKIEEVSLGNEEETIHTPEQLDHVSTGEDGKMKNQGIEERLHEELENTVLRRKNIEQNASDINREERMDDLSFYHSDGIESLKKKKQELNKKITEAYKKNSLHEEQTKNDLRELLKLRHQITIRNELQSIFGIDVIDFYRNDYLHNDGNNAKSYINMMDQIEKIMKKEQLNELNNTRKKEFQLTNIEKKKLEKSYILMEQNSGKTYKQGVKYNATEIKKILTNAIQNGALNKFEKYNYYDIEESKTMKKLGLHKWDIESLLSQPSVEVTGHSVTPKDLEDYSYKTEKELRNLKTKLNKKITTEFNKGRSDSVEFKQSLSQLREVLHQLEVRKVTKEMIGIDIEKFHTDYVSRLWIDPKEETSLLRKEVSTHLRENEGNGGSHLLTVLEHEKIAKDKKDILETYNSLKSFDKQKQWPLVNFYTETLLKEIRQVVKTNTEILAPNYNYNIPKRSKTLKKLGIDDFSVYLESNTNVSLEDNLGKKDEQQHAEVTDSRSSIPDGQVDLNDTEMIPSHSSLVDQDSRRTSLSSQETKTGKNLMNEVEQAELKPTFAMEIKKKLEEITKQPQVRQTNNELEKSNNKTNQRYESLSKNDNKLVEVQNKSIVDNYMNKPINSIHSEETKNGNIKMMAELSTPEVNTNEETLVNKGSNDNRDNISELKKQKEKVIIQIKKNIEEFVDLISVETREANIKLNVNEIRIEALRNIDNEVIAKNMSKALDHLCQKSVDMVKEMETDILQVQEKMSDNKELAYDFEKVDDLYDNYFFEDDLLEDNYKTINDKIRILSYHLKNIMDVKNSPNNLSLGFNNIDMQLTNLEDIGMKMYRIDNLQNVIENQLENLERISEQITSAEKPVIPPKPKLNQMRDRSVPVQIPFSPQKEGIKLSVGAHVPTEQKPSLSQKLQEKISPQIIHSNQKEEVQPVFKETLMKYKQMEKNNQLLRANNSNDRDR